MINLINEEDFYKREFDKIEPSERDCDFCGFLTLMRDECGNYYECHGSPDVCMRAADTVQRAVIAVDNTLLDKVNGVENWNKLSDVGKKALLTELVECELDA